MILPLDNDDSCTTNAYQALPGLVAQVIVAREEVAP